MEVLNAMSLKKGRKAEYSSLGTLVQPSQFLSQKDKTPEYYAQNMDWLEFQGLKQLRRNARRLLKNYKLAKGIIDKTDYIVEENQENADLIQTLIKDDSSALELKFYPIIPNVVNTLVSEFAKRSTRVSFRAVDDHSFNEMLDQKREDVEESLIFDAEQKLVLKLIEQGMSPDDPMFKKQMSKDNIKSLPQIQQFYTKSYRDICEQWAEHQHNVDVERFHMEEMEEVAFRDSLITDREFWHFRMMEDDYDIELWNPLLTFYHKTPEVRYTSQGNWIGKSSMITVADAVDKYGWLMTEEQLKSLEQIYPVRSAGYAIGGYQNDGSFYDATKSHAWNVNMPSLGMRQYMSVWDGFLQGGDIVNWIMSESEDLFDLGTNYLLRETVVYWKSQMKLGYLTRKDENNQVTTDIVDESYVVTDKPIYNTTLFKNKDTFNLIFGEHIEWIWTNQVVGGVKLGPNRPAYWGQSNYGGITPIYLGINQNKPGPLKFQFKGDNSMYGAKLPVEGSIFSDRHTRSTALVDLMKPYQIGFNITNNQIADILIDELGTVILFDQNMLPRHSMGEDWGKNNFAKAYVAMKNFQMLPLDTSITNTENSLNFNQFTKLDMEQTNRLLSRIQLSNYFQQQAYQVIGITPQRLGEQVEQATATGVRMAVSNSYAQTETYFIQHCDWLMPRVHQMRTDLAQFYQSTNPSLRLSYITTAEDRVNFKINGTTLLLKDLNVFSTTKANTRKIIEDLKALALNSTSGQSTIFELADIIKSESISEIESIMKEAKQKLDQDKANDQKHEQEMLDNKLRAEADKDARDKAFEASENDKDRKERLLEAEIKAAGYGAPFDKNENAVSDYVDVLSTIQQGENYQEIMRLDQSKQANQVQFHNDKMELGREKLNVDREKTATALRIARENTTASEIQAKRKIKADKAKARKKP